MERNINQIVNDTQIGLDEIRSKVVGFLQNRSGVLDNEMILSLSEDGERADTVRVSPLGAIHHSHNMSVVNFHVIMIPKKYGNFKNLLDKPFEWVDFHNENFKNIV